MRDRQNIRITLRLISVLLMAAAIGVVAYGPSVMLANQWDRYIGHRWTFWQHVAQHVYAKELPWAVPLVVVAGILWILQKPLARLIAPNIGPHCPECGYSLRGSKSGRCPECGIDIIARLQNPRTPPSAGQV